MYLVVHRIHLSSVSADATSWHGVCVCVCGFFWCFAKFSFQLVFVYVYHLIKYASAAAPCYSILQISFESLMLVEIVGTK